MTDKWGAPLTGAQMKVLRDAGLPDYRGFQIEIGGTWKDWHNRGAANFESGPYRLPANHIAYTVIKAGWLDKPNVRLWFGGDEAPSDWDGGDVLLHNGRCLGGQEVGYWWHDDMGENIIAYIAKADASETPDDDQQNTLVSNDEHQTVTIAKMTPSEAEERFDIPANEHHRSAFGRGAWTVLEKLGLIKPEPTREERFWGEHEPEGVKIPEHIKKWVKDALEFER